MRKIREITLPSEPHNPVGGVEFFMLHLHKSFSEKYTVIINVFLRGLILKLIPYTLLVFFKFMG